MQRRRTRLTCAVSEGRACRPCAQSTAIAVWPHAQNVEPVINLSRNMSRYTSCVPAGQVSVTDSPVSGPRSSALTHSPAGISPQWPGSTSAGAHNVEWLQPGGQGASRRMARGEPSIRWC
jgi:hypothetical protein